MATKIVLKVLAIGLFAGTLDIADALIFNVLRGITPVMVLQYIASGLIARLLSMEAWLPPVWASYSIT
ncbi:MAG TPA: hypothetical protein VHY59_04860 [Chthoniobacterales bacterium]|jgi:hypothetical protein|nr:hypothetical protein [Chthoniobacterales bacterium]